MTTQVTNHMKTICNGWNRNQTTTYMIVHMTTQMITENAAQMRAQMKNKMST
jgi:hypothetical protein